ncbi:MAG: rhodanese-like domain-containing protein [Candidatus Baltobacteraceae bacterium]
MIAEISVEELRERWARGDDFVLLDVREPDELQTAALPGALAIPMSEIPARLGEVRRDCDVVVMCHSGRRSERVTAFLNANGVPRAVNLAGGIDAWSVTIDPAVARY